MGRKVGGPRVIVHADGSEGLAIGPLPDPYSDPDEL
jgi:hypothetical protein